MRKITHAFREIKSSLKISRRKPLTEGLLINIGCGGDIRPGWKNCDLLAVEPSVVSLDIATADGLAWLSHQDANVIECNHVIGYLNYKQACLFFKSCFEGLLVGGKLILEFPDILKISRQLIHLNLSKCTNVEYLEIIRAIYAYDLTDATADSINFNTYITGWASDFVVRELISIGFQKVYSLPPETHGRRINRDSRIEAFK